MEKTVATILQRHKEALEYFDTHTLPVVMAAAEMILTVLDRQGIIYTCGNGGSAADAQHIAGELVGRFRDDRKPLAAVALATDSSTMTCIANDYGFEEIFSRQAEALVRPNDLFWAISTSGTSANVIRAVVAAKKKGAKILSFTGKPDSELEKMSDLCICAHCPTTSTSQEIHLLAYHIICELIDEKLSGRK